MEEVLITAWLRSADYVDQGHHYPPETEIDPEDWYLEFHIRTGAVRARWRVYSVYMEGAEFWEDISRGEEGYREFAVRGMHTESSVSISDGTATLTTFSTAGEASIDVPAGPFVSALLLAIQEAKEKGLAWGPISAHADGV